ncbi:hypothetical protein L195_g049777 [Trifolium pratense]|uniref:Uncharacterized protein n=1 Tax=Trifolium pratense TaxID=57577 RepID=A0A2K3JQE2_TRIPR|nr:hypothetical protein L195_g049777 [Trifolium pratense]
MSSSSKLCFGRHSHLEGFVQHGLLYLQLDNNPTLLCLYDRCCYEYGDIVIVVFSLGVVLSAHFQAMRNAYNKVNGPAGGIGGGSGGLEVV